MASPAADHAKESDKRQKTDWRTPKSRPAYIIAERYQNTERRAEQYDPDRLIASQQPVAQLIGCKKGSGYSDGSHVVREA
jgi:hypothetical protein